VDDFIVWVWEGVYLTAGFFQTEKEWLTGGGGGTSSRS